MEQLTPLVHIFSTLLHLCLKRPIKNARTLRHSTTALGQDGELMSGDLEFLDGFPDDLLISATGIDIGGIPG